MYANLLVKRADRPQEPYVAWKILAHADGSVTLFLDDPNDEGSYAVPAGEVVLPPGTEFSVAASF
jgi:hypothetical protein